MCNFKHIALSIPLMILPAATQAGVVIELETLDIGSDSRTTTKTSVDGKFVRAQVRETGGGKRNTGTMSEMIYHPATSDRGPEMLIVDHGDKSYRVMDEQTFEKLGGMMSGQTSAANSAMAEAMKKLTPEQRAMMLQHLQRQGGIPGGVAGPAAKPDISATGRSDEVAGIPCRIWEKREEGVKSAEFCVAAAGKFPYGSQVMPAFLDMSAFMKRMFESIPAARRVAENSMTLFKDLGGFPVRTRSFRNGRLESETTFKGAQKRDIDPREFKAPVDYQEKDMLPRR